MAEPRENPLEKVTYKQKPLGALPAQVATKPIDSILRDSTQDQPEQGNPPAKPERNASRPPKAKPSGGVKEPQGKLTVKIAEDIVERLKNAAYWTRRPLAEIAEAGLLLAVQKIEAANGGRFKERDQELRPGRPLGPAKT